MDYLTLSKLSDEQLRDMNRDICAVLRSRQTERQFAAGRAFRAGDQAKFESRHGYGTVRIIIDKINVKSVNGREIGADGQPTHKQWRVAPSLLQHV